MTDEFDNPEIANEALQAIMKAFPKSKAAEYFGDFNQIAVYLERRIREVKK